MDSFNSRLDDSLRKRTEELRRLTSLLRSELPPETDGHYQVANIDDRTLVIMTDSPVWTTRLRQLGPRILTVMQNSGRTTLLHIRVFSKPAQPPVVTPSAPVRPEKSRLISRQSSQLLNQTASCIADDGLRAALLKLAGHVANNNTPDKHD